MKKALLMVGLGVSLTGGCNTQECAYYNDCPSGEYCTGDGVCVEVGTAEVTTEVDPFVVPPPPDELDAGLAPWTTGAPWLAGDFPPAGLFDDDQPQVSLYSWGGFGVVRVYVEHFLDEDSGQAVFTTFELDEQLLTEGGSVESTQALMLGCNTGVPNGIDEPAEGGTVEVKPEDDGSVTIEFNGEFPLAGQDKTMSGGFTMTPADEVDEDTP